MKTRLELEDVYVSDSDADHFKLLSYNDLNKIIGIPNQILHNVYLDSGYDYLISIHDYDAYLKGENVLVYESYDLCEPSKAIWLNDLKRYFNEIFYDKPQTTNIKTMGDCKQ